MPFLKNAWYVAANASELDPEQPGEGVVTRLICNEPVVMFRTAEGRISAIQDRCPHRFVPLSMGKRVGDSLQCAYHGLRFNGSGAASRRPTMTTVKRRGPA